MSNDLSPQQSFENTLKDRIRNDIGTLIPDELLQQLISKTIEDVFFKDRVIKDPNYSHRDRHEPSVFKVVILETLQARAEKVMREWVESNGERIGTLLAEQINTDAEKLALSALTSLFNTPLMAMKNELNQVFQNMNIPTRLY